MIVWWKINERDNLLCSRTSIFLLLLFMLPEKTDRAHIRSLTLDSHVFDNKIVLYFFLFFFFFLCLRKERGAATQSSQYFKSVARANLRREKGKKRKKVLRFSGVTQYLLTIISLSIPHALYILHARKRRFITDARNIKSANQMEACESFETP